MEFKNNEDVIKYIEATYPETEVMTYPEYAEAFMGVAHQGMSNYVAVYNREKCLEILARDEEDDEDETATEKALQHFEFNTMNAWYGNGTPVFISDPIIHDPF